VIVLESAYAHYGLDQYEFIFTTKDLPMLYERE